MLMRQLEVSVAVPVPRAAVCWREEAKRLEEVELLGLTST